MNIIRAKKEILNAKNLDDVVKSLKDNEIVYSGNINKGVHAEFGGRFGLCVIAGKDLGVVFVGSNGTVKKIY